MSWNWPHDWIVYKTNRKGGFRHGNFRFNLARGRAILARVRSGEIGVNTLSSDKSPNPLIALAVYLRSLDDVKYCVENGANLEAPYSSECSADEVVTPLMIACRKGDYAIVEYLINNGANIHAKTDLGFTTLYYAIQGEEVAIAELLADRGVNVVNDTSASFHCAARAGSIEFVKFFVEHGASVGQSDFDDYIPIYHAVEARHYACVEYLLQQGSANFYDKHGRQYLAPALEEAVSKCNHAMVDLLVSHGAVIGDDYAILSAALASEDLEMLEYLLAHGGNIHARAKDGTTLLVKAAQMGKHDLAVYLCDKGVDLNAKTSEGHTALTTACETKSHTIVRSLLRMGAVVNERRGSDALYVAALVGDMPNVRRLLSAGATMYTRMDDLAPPSPPRQPPERTTRSKGKKT